LELEQQMKEKHDKADELKNKEREETIKKV